MSILKATQRFFGLLVLVTLALKGEVLDSETKPPVRLMQVALLFGGECRGRDVVQPAGITKTTHGRGSLLAILQGLGYNSCSEGDRIPLWIMTLHLFGCLSWGR